MRICQVEVCRRDHRRVLVDEHLAGDAVQVGELRQDAQDERADPDRDEVEVPKQGPSTRPDVAEPFDPDESAEADHGEVRRADGPEQPDARSERCDG